MTFQEALQLIEDRKELLGTVTEKGVLINLLLVVPTDAQQRQDFFNRLMFSHNPQQAIAPFIGSDVEVLATNADYLYKRNLFIYDVVR